MGTSRMISLVIRLDAEHKRDGRCDRDDPGGGRRVRRQRAEPPGVDVAGRFE
jgi:hypothetical protein